jgi:hypothetical protein
MVRLIKVRHLALKLGRRPKLEQMLMRLLQDWMTPMRMLMILRVQTRLSKT